MCWTWQLEVITPWWGHTQTLCFTCHRMYSEGTWPQCQLIILSGCGLRTLENRCSLYPMTQFHQFLSPFLMKWFNWNCLTPLLSLWSFSNFNCVNLHCCLTSDSVLTQCIVGNIIAVRLPLSKRVSNQHLLPPLKAAVCCRLWWWCCQSLWHPGY